MIVLSLMLLIYCIITFIGDLWDFVRLSDHPFPALSIQEFIPICIIVGFMVVVHTIKKVHDGQHDRNEELWSMLYEDLGKIKKSMKKKGDPDAPQ